MRWILGALLGATSLASPAAAATPADASVTAKASGETEASGEAEAPAEAPAPRRNAVVMRTHAKVPDWALSLGYQRALGRRFSVGGALEYGFQAPGYWHLQGVSESFSSQVWLGRPFHGVFAEGSLTVAHQFLVRQPRLSSTALVPGLGLGFRWTHRSGLTLGASGGLRWGRTVAPSDVICTRPKYCTSVRPGAYANITADIGFVF
ncbi:MAG: hypothetical protein H6712_04260 [Myxococcales bacterium]|nr:hypothetical protein [Myxococcales bacterium]